MVLAGIAALTACANAPHPSSASAPAAPVAVSMEEWMNRGDAALKQGDHDKARDAWRSAARNYPAAKPPWLKLAEDYFNAADYGNAVLAAQEALQRDPHDRLANSVLAVSGLRLTAGSLAALRDEGDYRVGSREEAVKVTDSLRQVLREPLLVPPPETASVRKRPPMRAVRPAARASGVADTPSVAPAATPAAAPLRPVTPPPRPATAPPSAGSPLDKLK